MTPESALAELLARVGGNNGAAVFVSINELRQWPAPAVSSMKSQKILTRARPTASVVCPGCELACTMPLETITFGPDRCASFVVCDKRSDINRVLISEDRIIQWRCDVTALCNFIAASLELTRAAEGRDPTLRQIGLASGKKRQQMLCLRVNGRLELVAGTSAADLAEVITFRDGAYEIDFDGVRRLVDSSGTGDSRHTPSAVRRELRKQETQKTHRLWQKAYRRLLRASPGRSDVWYSQQIAKKDPSKRKADTIRKNMKR